MEVRFDHLLEPWGRMKLDQIWPWRNPEATNYTEINGKRVNLEELKDHLIEYGCLDPLILRIYRQPPHLSIRLEEGNHRIQVFKKENLKFVPVRVELAPSPIKHLGNGVHLYFLDSSCLQDKVKDLLEGEYSPTEIFTPEFLALN